MTVIVSVHQWQEIHFSKQQMTQFISHLKPLKQKYLKYNEMEEIVMSNYEETSLVFDGHKK